MTTKPGELDLRTFADGKLVEAAGGTSLYIPIRFRPGSRIARLLGEEQMQALVEAYGGEVIEIPLGRNRSRHPERSSIIRTLLTQAISDQAIARAHHVHRRTVSRIRHRIRELFSG